MLLKQEKWQLVFKREGNSPSCERCKGNNVAKINDSRCVRLVLEV